jgi:hypothetical protein
MHDIILPVYSHQSNQTAGLWKCRWMKWSPHTTYSINCTNLIGHCSLVVIITTYYLLHIRWYIGWCNKPPQTTPFHSSTQYVSLGDIAQKLLIDTHRLSLSDNLKSDIAIVSVWTLHIQMHAISISNIYCVLPVVLVWIQPKSTKTYVDFIIKIGHQTMVKHTLVAQTGHFMVCNSFLVCMLSLKWMQHILYLLTPTHLS